MAGELAPVVDDGGIVQNPIDSIKAPSGFEDNDVGKDGVILEVEDVAQVMEIVAKLEGVGFPFLRPVRSTVG